MKITYKKKPGLLSSILINKYSGEKFESVVCRFQVLGNWTEAQRHTDTTLLTYCHTGSCYRTRAILAI